MFDFLNYEFFPNFFGSIVDYCDSLRYWLEEYSTYFITDERFIDIVFFFLILISIFLCGALFCIFYKVASFFFNLFI